MDSTNSGDETQKQASTAMLNRIFAKKLKINLIIFGI
jgi:hypothetical protein